MSELLVNVLGFVAIGLAGVFVAMLLAPLEALSWWAGWYGQDLEDPPPDVPAGEPLLDDHRGESPRDHYLVFLDGIAKASSENYDDVQALLDRLGEMLPNAAVLGDVLPYSVSGVPLTRSRPLSRFWRFAKEQKVRNHRNPVGFWINIRNLFQVAVSADRRYGPIYNFGEAQTIVTALLQRGYRPGSGVPITLIGYSGGGQVALGVTPYLKHVLRAPVDVISLGGVLSSDRGLLDVRYLYHLVGDKDPVAPLGTLIFPGRWRALFNSPWNRARRRGKLTFISLGPVGHYAEGGYLDEASVLEDGRNHLELTADTVRLIVERPEQILNGRAQRGRLRYRFDPPPRGYHLEDATS